MTNARKAKKNRKNSSGHSTLADHKRKGKTFTAPLNSIGPPTTSVPWLRDVYPSLIWMCAVLHEHGEATGTRVLTDVLNRLQPFFDASAGENTGTETEAPGIGAVLDGSLQSFDAIAEEHRAAALAALKEDDLYEIAFPWLFARAMSKYDDLPGGWILDGWRGQEEIVAPDAPEDFLARVTVAAWHGRSEVATRAKMLYTRAYILAGKVVFGDKISFVHLLPRYPHDLSDDECKQVEASMRAMFGAMWGGLRLDGTTDETERWAAEFWRQNWTLYCCKQASDTATDDEDASESITESDGQEPTWLPAQRDWEERLGEIKERFLAAHRVADPDLYMPDRNEVLTGITHRHLRAAESMILYPGLWSAEHGASILRSLVEGRIIQKWLVHKDDPDLFTKFKNYGRGHLKLHVLHLREYRDNLPEPIEGLDETIKSMEDLLERDLMEEFQDISVEGNFAGTDIRTMAYAVGLTREYRLVFAPMSANVHSEWITLEQYALMPCLNPLHRGHRIPNTDTRVLLGPELVDMALATLDDLVAGYIEAIDRGKRDP